MKKNVQVINLLFAFMSYFVCYPKALHGIYAFSRIHFYVDEDNLLYNKTHWTNEKALINYGVNWFNFLFGKEYLIFLPERTKISLGPLKQNSNK